MSDISSMVNVSSSAIKNIMKDAAQTSGTKSTTDSSAFDGIYNAAVNMISNTNTYLQDAQAAEVAFATGEMTNTHELAIIEQKANLSLQYTVAIKNQMLSAYREIMNMQV